MHRPPASRRCLAGAVLLLATACAGSARPSASVTTSTNTAPYAPAKTRATTSTAPRPVSAPTSTTAAPAPTTFAASVVPVSAAELGATWHAGCPVGPAELRALHVSFWGFDERAHTGTIVVAASVATAVVSVFRALYDGRVPIRRMQPESAYGGSDPMSMADDNTSGFNCRAAVAPGPPQWSAHAYGKAIDVNPVENPYVEGGRVQPPNGAPFLDRTRVRAGMAGPASALNRAFAAIGWQWGGRWSASPDYQHFSATGG